MYVCIASLSLSCSNDEANQTNATGFYKPSGVITQDRAVELSATWASKNVTTFRKSAEKSEGTVTYLRWSLEDLRNYLDYAEHEAKEKGYNMTGVRVYFGAYPEKAGQNTLFFAPAGYKIESQASVLGSLFGVMKDEDNIPVPPLNEGLGGSGGYP